MLCILMSMKGRKPSSELFSVVWAGVLNRYTRAELAKRCGMSRMKLYLLLVGRLPIRWEDTAALSRAVGLPADEILQRLLRMRDEYQKSKSSVSIRYCY